jgi:hypothetical protein
MILRNDSNDDLNARVRIRRTLVANPSLAPLLLLNTAHSSLPVVHSSQQCHVLLTFPPRGVRTI